ncbi:hypothetical protein GCM10008090_16780 [Arenicella chitinivorans]|uniref:Lasso RiPP family leader peptide-containing protein n=1 Tax=Arenicella chitinivorans TaxID=1329800 RepID=A0A918RRR6_9GAMM|nr:lasso RiPP family leader peptide-containing protein [Arenicella chitinivorans]GHA07600.1 hypothetical protein GCM10008090_16780 [Arenicella chitinivorans]
MKTKNNRVLDTGVGAFQVEKHTSKKPYEKPALVCYGDVRDVTLGPTLGGGESGCEGVFRVGPGGCPIP